MAQVASLTANHTRRVTRLYRASLKNLLNWCVWRDMWIEKAFELRAEFEKQRGLTDPRMSERAAHAERENPVLRGVSLSLSDRLRTPSLVTSYLTPYAPLACACVTQLKRSWERPRPSSKNSHTQTRIRVSSGRTPHGLAARGTPPLPPPGSHTP